MNLIEVFRRKKRLYLVFEFVDHTALDDLERYPTGADEGYVKKVMWQVLKGVEFCHSHNVRTISVCLFNVHGLWLYEMKSWTIKRGTVTRLCKENNVMQGVCLQLLLCIQAYICTAKHVCIDMPFTDHPPWCEAGEHPHFKERSCEALWLWLC